MNGLSDSDGERNVELAESIGRKFGKTFPNVKRDTARPVGACAYFERVYSTARYADTLLSDSDVNYQLSFDDGAEIPKKPPRRVAVLLRDGYFLSTPT